MKVIANCLKCVCLVIWALSFVLKTINKKFSQASYKCVPPCTFTACNKLWEDTLRLGKLVSSLLVLGS